MPKTTFIRKPINLKEVETGTRWIKDRHDGEAIDDYYIAKEVQLEENEFFDLLSNMLAEREWVKEFSNRMLPMKDGAVASIRVTCPGSITVLIIDPQGHDYPRYVGLEEA